MSRLSRIKDLSPRFIKDVANQVTRSWGVATAVHRADPDFLVIGTKRGGTTSLFNYLLSHPGILGLYPQVRDRKSTDYFFKHLRLGDKWYRSHFHTASRRAKIAKKLGYAPLSGEASPYYMWDPRVAQRAHEFSSNLRAIVLLRDPVARAWSHYQERVQNGVEPLSFTDALAAESSRTEGELTKMLADPYYYSEAHDWYSYRARGIYQPQLEAWTSAFPREQLLVLRSEDMYSDVQVVFNQVCRFLQLPTIVLPTMQTYNASPRGAMPESARADLSAFYAPINTRLYEFLGRDLGWNQGHVNL